MFDIYLGLRNSIVTHSCQRCSKGVSWKHDVCRGGRRPDVVLQLGINSITHTTGGGKRGECKGEENKWMRNNGKQEAETLQHNAPRVSCRLTQISSNTLLKVAFFTPKHFPAYILQSLWFCSAEQMWFCVRIELRAILNSILQDKIFTLKVFPCRRQ